MLLVLYLGYISFLKIVCLPEKNKRLKRKKIRNLKYSVCLIYTNWKGMDIRCMKRKAAEKVKFLTHEKFQYFDVGFIFE